MSWKYRPDEISLLREDVNNIVLPPFLQQTQNISLSQALGQFSALVADVTQATATMADTGLSFYVGANESWAYEFTCPTLGATNGIAFQLTGPASPTLVQMLEWGNTTGVGVYSTGQITAFSTPSTPVWCSSAVGGIYKATGLIVNGTPAGTVKLQFADVSGTNTTKVKAGAFVIARRVA